MGSEMCIRDRLCTSRLLPKMLRIAPENDNPILTDATFVLYLRCPFCRYCKCLFHSLVYKDEQNCRNGLYVGAETNGGALHAVICRPEFHMDCWILTRQGCRFPMRQRKVRPPSQQDSCIHATRRTQMQSCRRSYATQFLTTS